MPSLTESALAELIYLYEGSSGGSYTLGYNTGTCEVVFPNPNIGTEWHISALFVYTDGASNPYGLVFVGGEEGMRDASFIRDTIENAQEARREYNAPLIVSAQERLRIRFDWSQPDYFCYATAYYDIIELYSQQVV